MNKTLTENDYRYEYFLKDHLGNVRVVFTDKDDDGVADLLSEDSYYPFGMTMGGLSFSSDNIATNLYKFTGKENQDEHGLAMIDFGWRQYDNRLGRWFVVDKLAEFYHSHSPYAYVTNNPVNFIDPNGLYKIPLDGNSNGSRGPTSFRVYPKGYARGPSGWSRGADIHIPESNSNYFYYNCNNYSTWQSSYDNFVAQMGGPTAAKFDIYYDQLSQLEQQDASTSDSFMDWYNNDGSFTSIISVGDIKVQFPGPNGGSYTLKGKTYNGTAGIGLSFEIAFPDWIIGDLTDYNGFGIDFGVLGDNNGLGLYATTKSTKKSGFALSAQVEVFVAKNTYSSPNTNIDRTYLRGPGYEVGLGIWVIGGAYGVSNSADYGKHSTYSVFSFAIGLGLDMGFVDWKTKTYITGK